VTWTLRIVAGGLYGLALAMAGLTLADIWFWLLMIGFAVWGETCAALARRK
jgi:hypothetical protein